ncbi:MAG: shikimate kinase [Planctomycetaceae bacterium]|nr:shikimate kinase [Planctomycetaceae bacterium]
MIISLVGFRGSGKSSVAPLLATRLGMKFVDVDQEIELRAQQTISEIFANQGEEYFRKLEAETIHVFYQSDNLIVATGGGAILNPQTQTLIQNSGPVVWLQADVQATVERILKDDHDGSPRPALTDLDFQQEVKTLLEQREPIYKAVSNIQIDTATQTPDQITDRIIQYLEVSHRGKQ